MAIAPVRRLKRPKPPIGAPLSPLKRLLKVGLYVPSLPVREIMNPPKLQIEPPIDRFKLRPLAVPTQQTTPLCPQFSEPPNKPRQLAPTKLSETRAKLPLAVPPPQKPAPHTTNSELITKRTALDVASVGLLQQRPVTLLALSQRRR